MAKVVMFKFFLASELDHAFNKKLFIKIILFKKIINT